MREYNLGYTLKELFYKCEWWEILGLLYASYEDQILKNLAIENSRKEAEIEQKVKSGKLKGYYKPNLSHSFKNKVFGGNK